MDLTAKQFEELLCEFCKQDLPTHFTVEHDVKDTGGESGNKRQIDTKIRGRVGVSDILICGEAKNWNEPVGSETIDALVGKYSSGEIRANKIIVFSNMGYTQPAITRAKLLGIELLEPHYLGQPIQKIPYVIGIGHLGLMRIRTSHLSPQKNLMAINPSDYVILKGASRISFRELIARNLVPRLRSISKRLDSELSNFVVDEENVLYELKQKEGFRYNANFEVNVELNWHYHVEYLDTGILKHINSSELKIIELAGNSGEIASKVLLSQTKTVYDTKDEVRENIIEKNIATLFQFGLVDPDRQQTHPDEPIIIPL